MQTLRRATVITASAWGLLTFVLVLAVNMLADAMRDIIDPRTRREER